MRKPSVTLIKLWRMTLFTAVMWVLYFYTMRGDSVLYFLLTGLTVCLFLLWAMWPIYKRITNQ